MTPRRLLALAACSLAIGCQPAATPPTADPPSPTLSVPAPTDRPTPAAATAFSAPPVIVTVNRIVGQDEQGYFAVDPDGKNLTRLLKPPLDRQVRGFSLSPDGKTMAYLSAPSKWAQTTSAKLDTLHLHKVGADTATLVKLPDPADGVAHRSELLLMDGFRFAWSPDSREVLLSRSKSDRTTGKVLEISVRAVDAATGAVTDLTPRPGHWPYEYSPDGRGFVTVRGVSDDEDDTAGLYNVVPRDGKTFIPVLPDPSHVALDIQISPDGKNLLFRGQTNADSDREREQYERWKQAGSKPADRPRTVERLFVQPVGGKPVELVRLPDDAHLEHFCWSGDGKRVAYCWKSGWWDTQPPAPNAERKERFTHLVARNADGSGEPVEVMRVSDKNYNTRLSLIEWR